MPRPERGTVAALNAGVDGRVADIGAGDAVLREEGNLERQQCHDVIEPLLEAYGRGTAPRPKAAGRRNG